MPVRRQHTSCDCCRKARIGCDAASRGRDGCSNCVRRKRKCTFKWLDELANKRNLSDRNGSQGYVVVSHDLVGEHAVQRRQEALSLHHVLWDIFTNLFEPQLGVWIGNDCCPFKQLVTAPKTLISRLAVTLDNARNQRVSSAKESAGNPVVNAELGDNETVNKALNCAVHAFSARWLATSDEGTASGAMTVLPQAKRKLSEDLWNRARQQMYPVMARPSYRSSLALYLFGITPTAPDNTEAGISDLCRDVSLKHIRSMRSAAPVASTPNSQLWNEESSPNGSSIGTSQIGNPEHIHMEDTAYWFGIVCDVSRCLFNCVPTVLLPGRTGESKVWSLVRQQVGEFDANHGHLRQSKLPLSDELVFTILQLGSACKTMCWGAITRVQDALFHNVMDTPIHQAIQSCSEEINRFQAVFLPLLDICARDYLLLKETTKVSCFLLALHFNLGVLILIDTLEKNSNCADLLPGRFELRLASTLAIINLMRLTLCHDIRMDRSFDGRILLLDPYPEHISRSLSRAASSIIDLYHVNMLSHHAAQTMFSVIFTGLSIMEQVSYSAQENLSLLRRMYRDLGFQPPGERKYSPSQNLTKSPIPKGEKFQEGLVRDLAEQVDADPALVNETIKRAETNLDFHRLTTEYMHDGLQWNDFDFLLRQWEFADCFADI